jgi:hypothetical protein
MPNIPTRAVGVQHPRTLRFRHAFRNAGVVGDCRKSVLPHAIQKHRKVEFFLCLVVAGEEVGVAFGCHFVFVIVIVVVVLGGLLVPGSLVVLLSLVVLGSLVVL